MRHAIPALDPVSLWLDDLWVATLVKRASLTELWQLHAPAPYGFLVLEQLVRGLFGDGHLQLQAAPFLARLVSIIAMGWVGAELTRHFGLGLVAAAGMALQSELAVQAVRIKQYSLDACLCAVLLALALCFLRRPSNLRLGSLGLASLLALPCSFPSLFVGPPLLTLCALSYANDVRVRSPERSLRPLVIMLGFDALAAVWLLLIVRQKATPALQDFWSSYYPPHDFDGFRSFFRAGPGYDFLTGAFEPVRWLALLVPIGIYQLLRARWTRPLGALVVALHFAVLCSSMLRLYPLGVARLDSFARPSQLLAAVAALRPLVAAGPRILGPIPVSALCLVAASWRLAAQPVSYPKAGEKPLAAMVRSWLADADAGLVLFPWANWAFAYYTDFPVRLVPVSDSTNGFFAIPERSRSCVLRETWEGMFFSDYARDARIFDAQLATLLATPPQRLVFYGSHGDTADYRAMLRQLRRRGYMSLHKESRGRAIAVLLERR